MHVGLLRRGHLLPIWCGIDASLKDAHGNLKERARENPRVPEPDKKSRWKPWLIVFLSGIVLGTSSCAGFLSTITNNSNLSIVLALGFFAGLAATLVGALVLAIELLRSVGNRKSGGTS
jgi:hypothetical protein